MAVVDTHDSHIHTYCNALKLMFFPLVPVVHFFILMGSTPLINITLS